MNRFQVIALWLLGIAAIVYMFVRHFDLTTAAIAPAIIAVLILITFTHLKQPKDSMAVQNPGATHGHGMAAPPPKATNDLVNSSFPSVEVPVMGKPRIIFKKDSVEYKGRSIYYREAAAVCYTTINIVLHGIPSSQTYMYQVKGPSGRISASFASAFYIDNDKMKEKYAQILELSKKFLEPVVVARLVKEMFQSGAAIKIGGITFTRDGYSKKKLFGGAEQVKWADRVYIPQYHEGNVYVYKDKDGKARTFSVISMAAANSVLLPEFVQACYSEASSRKQAKG